MLAKERKALEDMASFIRYALAYEDKDFKWVLANIMHDCAGLIKEEKLFVPRTHGYSSGKPRKL